MKKIIIITFYDEICIGPRLLSSIAKTQGVDPYLIMFKGQRTKMILKDRKDYETYQFYIDGVKYGSCYAAYPYTKKELMLLVNLLKQIEPSIICLSTRSFGLPVARDIVKKLKENNVLTTIISGGWGPTLEPEKFLEFSDFVCFGEGEKAFAQICNMLNNESNLDFTDVPNLIYNDEYGKMHRNNIIPPLNNGELNQLTFPDFDTKNKYLIDKNKIVESEESYNPLMYNCFAGRGCPLSCTYCMSSKYRALYSEHGYKVRKFRVREVETVIEELVMGKQQGAKYIRMNDEVFPIQREWVKKFLKMYREKIDLPFFAYVRPEFHDPELIQEMVLAGLCSTIVGIQAGSESIRKNVFKRYYPTDKLIRFAKTVNKLNIDYSYHLINYNPFETEKDMEETIKLLRQLPYASLFIFKLVPLKGTPIYNKIQESRVNPLPDNVQKWYGFLYMMTVRGQFYRALSKFILKNKMFMSNLFMFNIFLFPAFLQLYFKKFIRKLLFGSYTLMPIPVKKKQ